MKGLARDAEIRIVPMGDFAWDTKGLVALIKCLHSCNIKLQQKIEDRRERRLKAKKEIEESIKFWEEIQELQKLEEQKRK